MSFERAKQHFLQGLAELQAGALRDAEASFEAALALVPDRPSTLINLGTVRLALGKNAEALVLLERAAALDASNVGVWLQCALLQQEQQRLPEALASLEQALALDAHNGAAWSNRGMLLRDMQRREEAAASFEKAIENGADAELNAFYLASLRAAQPNTQLGVPDVAPAVVPIFAPRSYVEKLFDSYAEDFSGHLVQALHYQGHQRLVQLLLQQLPPVSQPPNPKPFRRVLDVGCGTGLCGALLRSHAARLDGLDLSRAMVEKARAANLYDQLFHADAVAHLQAVPAGAYDLIIAADVFNYVGALEPLFSAAHSALAAGGRFCFTVEALEPDAGDMRLLPSLRYAHSQAYLRRVAAQSAWHIDGMVQAPLREDQGVLIAAWYVVLTSN